MLLLTKIRDRQHLCETKIGNVFGMTTLECCIVVEEAVDCMQAPDLVSYYEKKIRMKF